MAALAIEIHQLSKTYRSGTSSGYQTLRESLSNAVRPRRAATKWAKQEVHALREVDLSVDRGHALGVIGRNGAGKSTLLKILARITEPTAGFARTRGRVGALLDVGTGFHPELTGRENVQLNGAVLGMSRRDVARRFDEIISFAGVERFVDAPLKQYSSGMRLRLAFAVAAHLEADILVVDEVLATGDAEFQRRCLGKMSEFGGAGRTIVFVSHDLGAVVRLCSRAVWLDCGTIKQDGPTSQVVEAYLSADAETATAQFPVDLTVPAQLTAVAVTDYATRVVTAPRRDQELFLRFGLRINERVPGLDVSFTLVNRRGVQVVVDNWSDTRGARDNIDQPGEYEAVARIPPVLAAGEYVVIFWIGTQQEDLFEREVLAFRLHPRPGESLEELERPRASAPSIFWELRSSG